jgi:hypothetical protein
MAVRKLDQYSKDNTTFAWILLYYFMTIKENCFKDLLGTDSLALGLKIKEDKDLEHTTLYGHKMALLEQNDPALDIEDTEEDEVDLYDEYIDYADEMWDL